MNRLVRTSALALLVCGLTAARASADLVITLGNDLNLAPGGIGSIDISISYTPGTSPGPGMDSTLADFGLQLQITPVTGTSLMEFVPSPDPYGNPNYVFAGGSFSADNGLPFWFAPFTTTTLNDSINGGDSYDQAPGYVTIPTAPSTLFLATVDFQAAPGATLGDTFQISLVPTGSTFFDGQTTGLPYTSSGGLVTVSAVPEPSSLMMTSIASLMGLLAFRRSRR